MRGLHAQAGHFGDSAIEWDKSCGAGQDWFEYGILGLVGRGEGCQLTLYGVERGQSGDAEVLWQNPQGLQGVVHLDVVTPVHQEALHGAGGTHVGVPGLAPDLHHPSAVPHFRTVVLHKKRQDKEGINGISHSPKLVGVTVDSRREREQRRPSGRSQGCPE